MGREERVPGAAAHGWLLRLALLVACSLLLWGTLLCFALLWELVAEGPRAAVSHLMPGRHAGVWAYANAICLASAALVWTGGILLAAWGRRPRASPGSGAGGA